MAYRKSGEPHRRELVALHVLQLRLYPPDAPRYACDGRWLFGLGFGGCRSLSHFAPPAVRCTRGHCLRANVWNAIAPKRLTRLRGINRVVLGQVTVLLPPLV